MAGITKEMMISALSAYADGKEVVTTETGFKVGDDEVVLDIHGAYQYSSEAFKEALLGIILDQKETARVPAKQEPQRVAKSVPSKQDNYGVQEWRQSQDKNYNVAGKQAPNAFFASAESNKAGFSTQIISFGKDKDKAWAHVRVTDPRTGQYREDIVTHEKESFVLLKSWEDANAQNRYQRGLITGVTDNNLPILDETKQIKGMPANLWLTISVIRAWSFADRDAVTKAERRAQLKMLNREWRETGEVALETEEAEAVQGR